MTGLRQCCRTPVVRNIAAEALMTPVSGWKLPCASLGGRGSLPRTSTRSAPEPARDRAIGDSPGSQHPFRRSRRGDAVAFRTLDTGRTDASSPHPVLTPPGTSGLLLCPESGRWRLQLRRFRARRGVLSGPRAAIGGHLLQPLTHHLNRIHVDLIG